MHGTIHSNIGVIEILYISFLQSISTLVKLSKEEARSNDTLYTFVVWPLFL